MFTDEEREILGTQFERFTEQIAAQQKICDYIAHGLSSDTAGDQEWWNGYLELIQFFMMAFMSQFLEADPESQAFALDYIGAKKKEG